MRPAPERKEFGESPNLRRFRSFEMSLERAERFGLLPLVKETGFPFRGARAPISRDSRPRREFRRRSVVRNFVFSGVGLLCPAFKIKRVDARSLLGRKIERGAAEIEDRALKLLPTSMTKAEGATSGAPAFMPRTRPQASVLLPDRSSRSGWRCRRRFFKERKPERATNGLSKRTPACSCPAGIPKSGRDRSKCWSASASACMKVGANGRRSEEDGKGADRFLKPLAAGAETLG